MIRIGLDMSRLGNQRGGDETYSAHLARALTRIDPGDEYYLYFAPPAMSALVGWANERCREVGPASLWFRTPVSLPYAAWKDRVDVLHVVHVAPPFCASPLVVTAFDISYEVYPSYFPRGLRLRLSKFVPYSLRRASRILTISQFSKHQLAELYRVPEEKIEVVYCGVDTDVYHPIPRGEAWARLAERYPELSEKFIVYVGSVQPRKNIPRLLEAYAMLIAQERIEHQLVLVGKHKWLTSEVTEAVTGLGLTGRVRFTGHVPDRDLPLFFNAAEVMVFPSLFEGFGLPPLEAMACGTPVVCSRATALPEVVGDAAVLVDPYSAEDIARGIHAVLRDEAFRSALGVKGVARAKCFSWDDTASRALRVLREVAGGARGPRGGRSTISASNT